MRKTFFKYFGMSIDKRKQEDTALGLTIVNDSVVYVGVVITIIKWNIGAWIHKKDFIVGCPSNLI